MHLKGVQADVSSIRQAESSLSDICLTCEKWVNQVQNVIGRKVTTQGPQGTVSQNSIRSMYILKESLSSLGDFILDVNPDFQNDI